MLTLKIRIIDTLFLLTFFYYNLFSEPKEIKMFVLDEADEMLSRGFKDSVYEIFRLVQS